MNLNLFIDVTNKRLVSGPNGGGTFTLPVFFRQDNPTLVVTLLQANPGGGIQAPYTTLDVTGLSMFIGIGFNYGSMQDRLVAYQGTWTADTDANTLTAVLSLNTTQVDSLLRNALTGQTTAKFEVVISQGGNNQTVLQVPVTLQADVIRSDAPDPTSLGNTNALADAVFAIFANSNTNTVAENSHLISINAKLKSNGGILSDSNGLFANIGPGAYQIASGASPVTLAVTAICTPAISSTTAVAGGSLPNGNVYYRVSAIDPSDYEGIGSTQSNVVVGGGNNAVSLAWSAVTNAIGYNIYRAFTTGAFTNSFIAEVDAPTTVYHDDGSLDPEDFTPPDGLGNKSITGKVHDGALVIEVKPKTNGGLEVDGTGLSCTFGDTQYTVADGTAQTQANEGRVFAQTYAPAITTGPAYAPNSVWLDTSPTTLPPALKVWNPHNSTWMKPSNLS